MAQSKPKELVDVALGVENQPDVIPHQADASGFSTAIVQNGSEEPYFSDSERLSGERRPLLGAWKE